MVEGRGLAKGNSAKQTRVWTQCQVAPQHANSRIRQMVKRDEGYVDPHAGQSAKLTTCGYYPKQEPGAVFLHAGICAGGAE